MFTIAQKIVQLYQARFDQNSQLLHRGILESLNNLQVKTIESDYVLSEADHGYCIQSLEDAAVVVDMPSDLPDGFYCTVERLGSGALSLRGVSVTVNGEESPTLAITNQWTSLYARVYGEARAKVEGSFTSS